jgi:hypothetical protein
LQRKQKKRGEAGKFFRRGRIGVSFGILVASLLVLKSSTGVGSATRTSVTADEYRGLLEHFAKKGEIPIGTGFTERPTNSVGQWLVDHRGSKPRIAFYVGPILIAEGYAKRGKKSDLIQFGQLL